MTTKFFKVSSGKSVTLDFVYAATRVHEWIFAKPNLVSLVLWVTLCSNTFDFHTQPVCLCVLCVCLHVCLCLCCCSWLQVQFLIQAEEEFGKKTVFDSIYKLDLFCRKAAKNEQVLEWILCTACHLVQTGIASSLALIQDHDNCAHF